MQNLESFLILINNLSDVYIFTVVTMFSLAAVTLYCSRVMNRNLGVTKAQDSAQRSSKKKAKNSDTEEDDGENNRMSDHSNPDSDNEELGRDFVREMKAAKLKELEEALTDEQIEEERRIESQQLAAIFDLLKKQEEEFNCSSMDENEFKRQLSLYR